jgi:hypothetical protein
LGAETPGYLEGRALENIFIEKKEISHRKKQADLSQKSRDKQVLTAQEEDEITKRLSALGYMD